MLAVARRSVGLRLRRVCDARSWSNAPDQVAPAGAHLFRRARSRRSIRLPPLRQSALRESGAPLHRNGDRQQSRSRREGSRRRPKDPRRESPGREAHSGTGSGDPRECGKLATGSQEVRRFVLDGLHDPPRRRLERSFVNIPPAAQPPRPAGPPKRMRARRDPRAAREPAAVRRYPTLRRRPPRLPRRPRDADQQRPPSAGGRAPRHRGGALALERPPQRPELPA